VFGGFSLNHDKAIQDGFELIELRALYDLIADEDILELVLASLEVLHERM
jgi:hypothetical protein